MIKKIKTICVTVVVIYSIVLSCVHFTESKQNTIVYDTIPGDTVFAEIKVKEFVPKIVKVPDVDTMYIPENCDSLRDYYLDLLHKHYSAKYYKDTLKNDSSATIVLESYISQNNLDSIDMSFKNNRPTAINTIIEQPYTKLLVGVSAGYKQLSPFVQYNFNNKYGLGLSYNAYEVICGNTILPISLSLSYSIK